LLIVNAITPDRGWSPIQHMVAMAGELLDCKVVAADRSRPSAAAKMLSILRKRRRNGAGDETCLLVCTGPADLVFLLNMENWRSRFRHMAAWIIDSFWLDHIPRSVLRSSPFDQYFVTSLEDVDPWKQTTGVPTSWLPWGTDALGLGHGGPDRAWDVTRVGRQPPEWDGDAEVGAAAAVLGIRHRGRPDSTGMDSVQNQKMMMTKVYGNTKYILAFSNAVNCESNNHPTREYLTGRWVDSLAGGAIVAGVAPRGPNTDNLLWPGATLELGGIRREEGLLMLAASLKQWTPDRAARNYRMALKRLDWRWRFKTLAEACEVHSEPLARELKLLEQQIARLPVPAGSPQDV
jgi:hypothetical protein